ncbi:hypothetical protein ACFY00_05455 [Kitasatospora sp. NPDC001540]|uniref:hypothetical protein n=1 Tax=Kitasatospora sp. NPDC001540 TaxID=3364014 RepID=UPI003678AA20
MTFDHTDAWHPTVNPSARMPIHYLRHIAVLGHQQGILNEYPRHRGGTTIRLPRFHDDRLDVLALPGRLTFAPWWLPANDSEAVARIKGIYDTALARPEPTDAERAVLARLRDTFTTNCTRPGTAPDLTVGEALWRTADQLHRELTPGLPELDLVSLTRSPSRRVLAAALAQVPGGLLPILARWARAERAALWPLLAVATSDQGLPLRVRLHPVSGRLDTEPLPVAGPPTGSRPAPLTEDDLIALLAEGRLIPGSRLTALAETVMLGQGEQVRHFGNTYGHLSAAGHLTGILGAERIPSCPDDGDSWHYADLPLPDGGSYPLHLIELAACSPQAHTAATGLITASLALGGPVHLGRRGDLDARLRSGGARLLR